MKRPLGLACALLLPAGLFAQAPARPAFEVATIKAAPPLDPAKIMSGQAHVGLKTDAARVDIGFSSLAELIRVAYRIKPYQLSGAESLPSQRWDIAAIIPEGETADHVPEMLQTLLADRFKLAVHHSNAEHPIYALVVGKNGLKLKDAAPDTLAAEPPRGAMTFGSGENQVSITPNPGGRGSTISSAKFGQMKISMGEAGSMRMEFSKMKMPDLADLLSQFADRPVLDLTELKGTYQVTLDVSMQDLMNVARAAGAGMMGQGFEAARLPVDASTPTSSIFTAVQQLGLKLDARKAPLETIVIDHVEKTPTEN